MNPLPRCLGSARLINWNDEDDTIAVAAAVTRVRDGGDDGLNDLLWDDGLELDEIRPQRSQAR